MQFTDPKTNDNNKLYTAQYHKVILFNYFNKLNAIIQKTITRQKESKS